MPGPLGKLIPCGGGAPITLGKPTVVIGRHPECDIAIPCGSVSGRHCELKFDQGAWSIRDLGSKNGTKVNDVRTLEHQVAPDDVLSIGRQRFVISYHAGAPKPGAVAEVEDIDALALELFTRDDEPAPPLAKPAPPPAQPASKPPHPPGPSTQAPHLSSRPMLGKLLPCGGGDPIPLLLPELTIGRHPSSDICLKMPAISTRHCKLSRQDGYWFVEDLKSTNGTWVDSVRCQGKKSLLPNCTLGLGKHRFGVHYTPTGDGPPPEEEDIFTQSLLEKAGLAKKFASGDEPDEDDPKKSVYRLDA